MIIYCVVVRVHLLLCVQPMNECRLCTMWVPMVVGTTTQTLMLRLAL